MGTDFNSKFVKVLWYLQVLGSDLKTEPEQTDVKVKLQQE